MRLVRAELRRLWARRMTWILLVVALVTAAGSAALQWDSARPPTPAEIAEAESSYDDELEYYREYGQEDLEACVAEAEEAGDSPEDWGCDAEAPRLEDFLPAPEPFVPDGSQVEYWPEASHDPAVAALQKSIWSGWNGLPFLATSSTLLLVLAFVVGVSFVTAEVRSGALASWLTFEPCRHRVYWSKTFAAAIGVVPLVLVGWAAMFGAHYVLYASADNLGALTDDIWLQIGGYTVRLALAGLVCGALGVAAGFLAGRSAAAIAAALVLLYVSSSLTYILGQSARWLPSINFSAWLNRGTVVEYYTGMDDLALYAVGGTHGGLYLLAFTTLLTAAAALVFRRRDLT